MSDEEFVRAHWTGNPPDNPVIGDMFSDYAPIPPTNWAEVRKFTEYRKEEIGRLDEEIGSLYKLCPCRHGSEDCRCDALDRIRLRLMDIRKELTCDMKDVQP